MKKKYTKRIFVILAAILLLAMILTIVILGQKKKNRTFAEIDRQSGVELSGANVIGYQKLTSGVLRYSRDGAEAIDKNGEVLWNVSYDISDPIVDVCGDTVVVADRKGQTLYIMDGSGDANLITMEHVIAKAVVSAQGVCAVLMDAVSNDYIALIDKDGNRLVDMNTLPIANGFPVDLAISSDGTRLVTSYVRFERDALETQLTFYNFGNVGKNYVDNLVGVEKYSDVLLADVAFAGASTVIAFGEKGARVFEMEEIPELKKEISLAQSIYRVCYSDSYVGFLTSKESPSLGYQMQIFDLGGSLVEQREVEDSFEHMMLYRNEVILFQENQICIYRIKGADKINSVYDKAIECVYPIAGSETGYLLVGKEYADRITLMGDEKESETP